MDVLCAPGSLRWREGNVAGVQFVDHCPTRRRKTQDPYRLTHVCVLVTVAGGGVSAKFPSHSGFPGVLPTTLPTTACLHCRACRVVGRAVLEVTDLP
jgi:hypothetical protein